MTPGMILRLFLSELMLAGFAGVLNGLLAGLLIIRFALPRLIFALQIAMRIYIDIRSLWLGPVIGLGIAATASLLCLLFLRRENPMSGLREE
jgi:ABC-type antimicrobial peptide transport system permease subunit